MTDWIEITAISDLPPGERIVYEHDDLRILIVNVSGNFYAIESLCTHAMVELDDAEIEDCAAVCPLHGAHFCLKTGRALSPPAFEDVPCYETRVKNGVLELALPNAAA